MKTGGTMNFLRRAGAILMVVAIFASSCNKYADDFEQINTKLDALAAQVAGVTQLTTEMATLKGQVTALQAAVAALPTATAQSAQFAAVKVETDKILAQIALISTQLTSVANTGNATALVVAQLKKDLDALTKTVGDNNTAMNTKLDGLATSDTEQSAQLKALVDANVVILAKIADLQTSLDGVAMTGADSDTATALTIKGLQLMLDAQNAQLAIILANTSMYNGDVNITSDAEVTFYYAKLAQLGIVNGNVKVNFAAITAAKLAEARTIVKQINAVIGTTGATPNTLTVTFKAGDALDFSTLVSVAGAVSITGGETKATGADCLLPLLSSVGGTLTFSFDGPYASTTLTNVGGDLILVNRASSSTLKGTTLINFPSVVVASDMMVDDAVGTATGIVSYPEATEVILGGGVTSLTADVATTVKLSTDNLDSYLVIDAPEATTVDLAALKTVVGYLSITAAETADVKLDNFTNAGTSVTSVDVTITGPLTISLPKYVKGLLTSDATTVTLAKHEGATNPVLSAVTNLTFGTLNNTLTLSNYPTLEQASVTGKTQTKWNDCNAIVSSTENPELTTLTLGGVMEEVSLIAATPASSLINLTSITTSGQINKLTVKDVDGITTGLTLGHKQFVGALGFGATGSELYIVDNNKLSVLKTTALDKLNYLVVTGNAKLIAFDFSSYTNLKDNASPFTVTITNNGGTALGTATYTAAVVVTGSTPYQEAIIKSNSILTLKAYFAKAAATDPLTATLRAESSIDINLATPTSSGGTTAKKLATVMGDNAAVSDVVNATGGIDIFAEMALVVAE